MVLFSSQASHIPQAMQFYSHAMLCNSTPIVHFVIILTSNVFFSHAMLFFSHVKTLFSHDVPIPQAKYVTPLAWYIPFHSHTVLFHSHGIDMLFHLHSMLDIALAWYAVVIQSCHHFSSNNMLHAYNTCFELACLI